MGTTYLHAVASLDGFIDELLAAERAAQLADEDE